MKIACVVMLSTGLDGNDGLEALNEIGEHHCGFLHFPVRRAVHSRNTALSVLIHKIPNLPINNTVHWYFLMLKTDNFHRMYFSLAELITLSCHYLAKGSARLVSCFVLFCFVLGFFSFVQLVTEIQLKLNFTWHLCHVQIKCLVPAGHHVNQVWKRIPIRTKRKTMWKKFRN